MSRQLASSSGSGFLPALAVVAGLLMPVATYAEQVPAGPIPAVSPLAAAADSPLVSLTAKQVSVEKHIELLNQQLPARITLHSKLGSNSIDFDNTQQKLPVETALNLIASGQGLVWWREKEGGYCLGTHDYYRTNVAPPATAPAPADAVTWPSIAVMYSETKLDTVCMMVSAQSKCEVTALGKARSVKVSGGANDEPVNLLLDRITEGNGLVWWREATGTTYVATREWYVEHLGPLPPAPAGASKPSDPPPTSALSADQARRQQELIDKVKAEHKRLREEQKAAKPKS